MIKVLSIIGTRPEVIKTAVLHKLLLENEYFELKICSTGQHKAIFDDTLSIFGLSVDFNLPFINADEPMMERNAKMTSALDKLMKSWQPELCLIQGDTLSAYSGAQAAFMNKIPIAHVEAGLRSHDMTDPYPEEMFRHFIDSISDLLFAPTYLSKQNLMREQIQEDKIYVTGNTTIDTLTVAIDATSNVDYDPDFDLKRKINQIRAFGKKPCLMTMHRRENWGEKIQLKLLELDQIALEQNLFIFYPLHPNPDIESWAVNTKLNHIEIMPALKYFDLIWALQNVDLIFSDSGGIQEECAFLNKPVIVLREKTERPEGITHRSSILWKNFNADLVEHYISSAERATSTIYGDGTASEQIMSILEKKYNKPTA